MATKKAAKKAPAKKAAKKTAKKKKAGIQPKKATLRGTQKRPPKCLCI